MGEAFGRHRAATLALQGVVANLGGGIEGFFHITGFDDLAAVEAKRQGMTKDAGNAMDMIRAGRIKYRQWPVQQDLETWNDFWSEYKGA